MEGQRGHIQERGLALLQGLTQGRQRLEVGDQAWEVRWALLPTLGWLQGLRSCLPPPHPRSPGKLAEGRDPAGDIQSQPVPSTRGTEGGAESTSCGVREVLQPRDQDTCGWETVVRAQQVTGVGAQQVTRGRGSAGDGGQGSAGDGVRGSEHIAKTEMSRSGERKLPVSSGLLLS